MSNSSRNMVESLWHKYNQIMALSDPRVEELWLMQSPVPIVIICLSYIYFVLSLGPRLMADRKPLNLRTILVTYNAAQTIFSATLFYLAVKHWIKCYGWGLGCFPINFESTTEDDLWTIRLCHAYFVSKITELADTVFFVLKKKNNHISLLHVFHHSVMPFSVWVGVKFHAGGNLSFFGLPNLFVHIWMYMYYGLMALGPQYQKYIWWKRHITQMQLGQFAMVLIYMTIVFTQCNLNRTLGTWILGLTVAFIFLFLDFYRRAYKKSTKGGEVRNTAMSTPRLASDAADGSARKMNGLSCHGEDSTGKKDL